MLTATVTTPNGKAREVHPSVAEGLASRSYNWYICPSCAGGDQECEYCKGTGYCILTEEETGYGWISEALENPSKVRKRARGRYLRRRFARFIRNIADRISNEE